MSGLVFLDRYTFKDGYLKAGHSAHVDEIAKPRCSGSLFPSGTEEALSGICVLPDSNHRNPVEANFSACLPQVGDAVSAGIRHSCRQRVFA
jgi:hypothetical protein